MPKKPQQTLRVRLGDNSSQKATIRPKKRQFFPFGKGRFPSESSGKCQTVVIHPENPVQAVISIYKKSKLFYVIPFQSLKKIQIEPFIDTI